MSRVQFLKVNSGDSYRTAKVILGRQDGEHRVPASDLPADIRAALLDWLGVDPNWLGYRCPHYWAEIPNRCTLPLDHDGEHQFPQGKI